MMAGMLAACAQETVPPPPPVDPTLRVPQQVLEGVRLVQNETAGPKWALEASRGVSYGPREPIALEDLQIEFFESDGTVGSVLTSKRGDIDRDASRLIARDSVLVVTKDGDRLETESLDWNQRSQKISTDQPFRLWRGRDVLTGVGIETDPDLRAYTILHSVRATVLSDPPLEEQP